MAVANLVSEVLTETIVKGALLYTLTRRFEVIAANKNVGAFTILQAIGLPVVGAPNALGGSGITVYCQTRKPLRDNPVQHGTKWWVDCIFTNDTSMFNRDQNGKPVTDPEQIVKTFNISFQEFSAPITEATLKSITKDGPFGADGATDLVQPAWLTDRLTKPGPIVNSAGKPIEAEQSNYREIIAVSNHVNNWDGTWRDFLGAINSDEITITQEDSRGTRLTETYPEFTLLMQDILKEDIWKGDRLYFRRHVTMAFKKETWIHAELDKGMERRILVGQYKPDGTQFDADDLTTENIEGDYGLSVITTGKENERVTLGEPVQFNGSGMEQPVNNIITAADVNGTVFLNWDTKKLKAFGVLNL